MPYFNWKACSFGWIWQDMPEKDTPLVTLRIMLKTQLKLSKQPSQGFHTFHFILIVLSG